MIGTFLVIGIILAAVIGFGVCHLHRRQRRRRAEITRESVIWPSTSAAMSYSGVHLPDTPPMRTISIDISRKPSVVWGPRPGSYSDAAMVEPSPPASAYTPHEPRGVGLAVASTKGFIEREYDPFTDLYAVREESSTGLAITTGQGLLRQSTHSFALSSPSLYSMKTGEDGDSIFESTTSGQDHSLQSDTSESRPLSFPTTVSSYTQRLPKPSSPIHVALQPLMNEISQIQGHQMVNPPNS